MSGRFDFSHLHVKRDAQTLYTLYQLDCPPGAVDRDGQPIKHPRLWLAPATEETPPYWHRITTHSGRNARRLRSGRVDPSILDETREHDLKLFPIYIVKDWDGVFDSAGKPVVCNKETCGEFLRALPNWVFNEIRNYASEPTNFLDEDVMGPEEAQETGEG